MEYRFVVGSNAFFSKYEDFKPHDNDILILEDNPTEYKYNCQIRLNGNCYFKWRRMPKEEFISCHKDCTSGLLVGKFLVPDFAKEIGLDTEDLKALSHLIDNLDEKHTYERIIFESYIENGDFYLTDEQLDRAYEEYKKRRT